MAQILYQIIKEHEISNSNMSYLELHRIQIILQECIVFPIAPSSLTILQDVVALQNWRLTGSCANRSVLWQGKACRYDHIYICSLFKFLRAIANLRIAYVKGQIFHELNEKTMIDSDKFE